jgi:hypothetical protein
VLALVMAALTALGFAHLHRVAETEEVLETHKARRPRVAVA